MAALLARLGLFSARHRVAVLLAWIVVLILTAVVTLTGMRFASGGFDVPGTDSSRAMKVLEDKFGTSHTPAPSLQLVMEAHDGKITDAAGAIATALAEAKDVPRVAGVTDPLAPTSLYVSPDGTTAVAQITFHTLTDAQAEEATKKVSAIATELRHTGLTVEVGNSLAAAVPEIMGPSELVGAAIAFLVLLLTFGSLVAAGANMAGALLGVGVGVLGVLAYSAVSPIGTVTPILAVMLGLAVGIDYGLFILSRFRTELLAGRSTADAIARATGTAGSSVAFAGATVIIALACLTVVGIPFIGEMGLAAAFAVAIAVLMSLTLLPALMSWMGRSALRRRDRAGDEHLVERSPRWAGVWGRAVTRRPWIAILATVIGLGLVAAPVVSMQTSLSIPGGENPDSTQRAAYHLVADKFGAGAQDPLVVLVESRTGITTATTDAQSKIQALHGVKAVIPSGVSKDKTTAMLTVFATTGPLDDRTKTLVQDIRGLHLAHASMAVTGSTAIGLDSDTQLRTALVIYVALIVGLSLLLLIVLFRSLLVPLIATAGFLLSLGAGLGATVAVFQWGWIDALVQAPQGNPLLSLLPIVVTGILFGLAMDYQVFLVSRIHEAYRRGLTPRDAIRAGFERSAPVVVAAAAIMTAVFGGFALSPSSLVGSIALALAVGVIADAFLVRMILVPASLVLLGRSAWWIPKWLDRILPHMDVEGEHLDDDAQPATTHPPVPARAHVG
jgi:RND superfamily putative drug exporter